MPSDLTQAQLKTLVNAFVTDQKRLAKTADGLQKLQSISAFGDQSLRGSASNPFDTRAREGARKFLEFAGQMSKDLVQNRDALVVDLTKLGPEAAKETIAVGLQTLASGAMALLMGQEKLAATHLPDVILHSAFGTDKASALFRKTLLGNNPAWPFSNTNFKLPDINKLILAGTLREYFQTLRNCGYAAQQQQSWAQKVAPIGRVLALSKLNACSGDKLTITYAGFGTNRPDPTIIADIYISLPTSNGCVHQNLRSFVPDFFDGGWADSGSVTVILPSSIITGCIGFFAVPPPLSGEGPCVPGSLSQAAGMVQTVLGEQFGGWGVMFGQMIVDQAVKVDAARFDNLPCADCQIDNLNHLNAGPPIIGGFQVVERDPVYPRGFVTLRWAVSNANLVEIDRRPVVGSENPNQLPPITGPLPLSGSLRVAISCTQRWEGEYVLRASNSNGCSQGSVESSVPVHSGFSDFKVGAAKADITDERPGLPMAGFAFEKQKTLPLIPTTTQRIDTRQFARAFVIEENKAGTAKKRITLVVADIWTCTIRVKTDVLAGLQARFPDVFDAANVLIAATHTHAGPGGYSDYALYNKTIEGFDAGVCSRIVDGIVSAISDAYARSKPGRVFVNKGELADCGANRSFEAFKLNPEFPGSTEATWTDREMLLLKFVKDLDSRGATEPIGALNWFAIHPTSLGMRNALISGDNKGWAEQLFETEMAKSVYGFVAAFGNGNAGDVSGNMTLDSKGRKTVKKPLGGPNDPAELAKDLNRMRALGDQQFSFAKTLYDSATTELTGSLAFAHSFVDMSSVTINGQAGARTWPAALGVSFGAGSSEDSDALVFLKNPPWPVPDEIPSGIIEGMDRPAMVLGGILATPALVQVALSAPQAAAAITQMITTGLLLSPALLPAALGAVVLLGSDHARSFVASNIGAASFPGAMREQNPKDHEWVVPWLFDWPKDFVDGQGAKPIMFPVGLTSLKPTAGGPNIACPMVPNVVPLHLVKIGTLAIVGVPAEFNSTAGRRMKGWIKDAFGGGVTDVAISGYTNGYSGYVATPEEYAAQHYEGASTLYGPHTLAAYRQCFEALVSALKNGGSVPTTAPFQAAPFLVPERFDK
jgi:Neutral/alkaline non-lysosomal ceramidase, N-terminal